MLKNIDPLLTPELLKVLCEMGHGDEIVLADANFTAESLGRGRIVLRLPGADMQRSCAAVLSVFPLDEAVAQPAAYMRVGGSAPGYRSELQRAVIAQALVLDPSCDDGKWEALERFAFYERAARAYAIVQTGEMQPWANVVFKKGVLADRLLA
ncbi:MAG: RbsD/FucU domain-containing protein [Burkholderiaceae bacterium]